MKAPIFAPPEFWEMPEEERALLGCGPGRVGDYLVPDSFFGLSIRIACQVHDFMYRTGQSITDKARADRVFMNNTMRIVNAAGGILRWPRKVLALFYYKMVDLYGGLSFWDGKNEGNEEKEVEV